MEEKFAIVCHQENDGRWFVYAIEEERYDKYNSMITFIDYYVGDYEAAMVVAEEIQDTINCGIEI